MNGLGVSWVTNMPLPPWYKGFLERLVRITKEVLRGVAGVAGSFVGNGGYIE